MSRVGRLRASVRRQEATPVGGATQVAPQAPEGARSLPEVLEGLFNAMDVLATQVQGFERALGKVEARLEALERRDVER
jgi:hypothetical protein